MNEEQTLMFCGFTGAALLETQKLEFLIHGIVAHLMHHEEISQDKRLSGLSAEIFLSEDPKDKKKRKQSLGVIIGAIKKKVSIDELRLNNYLSNRNKFIHSLWRDYLKNYKVSDGGLDFVQVYIKETDHWMKVFKGVLGILMRSSAEKEGRNSELSEMNTMDDEIIYYIASEMLNKARQSDP